MDTGTNKNNLDWLSLDVLMQFIDELREAGYKIGVSQYIAAQDLILMLIAQGESFDSPERLRSLLGPIFCSSPTEQEEFQQRFDRWFNIYSYNHLLSEELNKEAQVLSKKLKKVQFRSYQLQKFIRLIFFFLLFLSLLSQSQKPIKPPEEAQIERLPEQTILFPQAPARINLPFNLQIFLIYLFIYTLILAAFFCWHWWWWWRAKLFLQRQSTTQQPELHKISFTGFEDKLVSNIVLLKVAQSLRSRIPIPSHELDVDKTIHATLSRGGWLTPIYRTYQVIPEYLVLVNRFSHQDHQAKFVEEIITDLKKEGVFITIYFFDDDPRICFDHEHQSVGLRLREIRSKYSEHYLIIISDIEKFFSSITGDLEPWVNQLTTWKNRAIFTPIPVGNWGHQELKITQQFMILPATIAGLKAFSQRLQQGFATYEVSEEARIPLADLLSTQPYRWIERNAPPSEQITAMLDSLEEYLGQDSFFWLSACAVFPKLHWDITIYLGNILKNESGKSLIEVCSLSDLTQLPWLRYGYMPDWLRVCLITRLTQEQQQIIRNTLQNLLITAAHGSVSKSQLEIVDKYHHFLPNLINPLLHLLSQKSSADSLVQDYIFLNFMTRKSVLAMQVSDEFIHSISNYKKHYSLVKYKNFLKWCFWVGVALVLPLVIANPIINNYLYSNNFHRYFVAVNSSDYQTLQRIRQIEPTAYIRLYRGRSIILAGVFNKLVNAQHRAKELQIYGINNAQIVTITPDQQVSSKSFETPEQQSIPSSPTQQKFRYYVVIPANSEDLPAISDTIIQNSGYSSLVRERQEPLGPHVAVGPFAERSDADRWNRYIQELGYGNARVSYSK
ncbi:hypothetical protein [Nostoc sp. FACHB-145]|uniref:hypothetical protein n=1 Tax=Nostoc sp. FACHB-145 TaxID=2692836 RepID=UPI001686E1B6|nr:hypothetical protein [Nostoc sp. FACHB-145]MBD2471443.1 hypothetical protein [Nostoc sp. FACHB-145]